MAAGLLADFPYIGQTGRSLRERTRALARSVFRDRSDPPWNDPHTAGPALWAWRLEDELSFEVSVAAVNEDNPTRQCLEDMLLYLYRSEAGESTLANHGRFHPRWIRPSNKAQGRRMERLTTATNSAAGSSLPPAPLHAEPEDDDWLRLAWSERQPLPDGRAGAPGGPGVYRMYQSGSLVYLGESKSLRSRLRAHNSRVREHNVYVSWTEMPGALPHQLKEREADLIGAFFLATDAVALKETLSRTDRVSDATARVGGGRTGPRGQNRS